MKQFYLYTLTFFAALIVFSVLLFPKNKFADYISQSVEKQFSEIKITYEKILPSVPFGVKFKKLNIIFSKETHCTINELNFQFEPKSLEKIIFQVLSLSDVHKDFINGKFIIQSLTLNSDARILKQLNLQAIDFSDIEFEFIHKSNNLELIKGMAIGSLVSMEFFGIIKLTSPLQTSGLNIVCKILPGSLYLKKISSFTGGLSSETQQIQDGIKFKIYGTLKNPKFII